MEIKPHIGRVVPNSSQPTGTVILAAVNTKRLECVITLKTAGGPFYIKRFIAGVTSAASATNFDWMLINVGDTIFINDWCGQINVSVDPAGAINVSELQ